MKITISFILALFPLILFCQIPIYNVSATQADRLLDSAKLEFNKEFDDQDYEKAVQYLERALMSDPNNAEVLYYLGYSYSRKNSKDGRSIPNMNFDLTIKSSEQFEKLNKIEPKYEGEIVILDPTAKITAEWGSLALKYLSLNRKDSALLAFNEGKRRGGFSDYLIELDKKVLESCNPNSILIASGDMSVFPLLYLQNVNNYRTDVSIMCYELLGTSWYPHYLSENKIVAFDISSDEIDEIEYVEWTDSLVTIDHFSWIVKPVYRNLYLLRDNTLYLSILKENKFKRDVYFTIGFPNSYKLNLDEYLEPLGLIEKIKTDSVSSLSFGDYKQKMTEILELSKHVDSNNPSDLLFLQLIKYNIQKKIDTLIDANRKNEANELILLMDRYDF